MQLIRQRWAASVRRARQAAGWSQSELARRTGVATSTISRLEAALAAPHDELKWKIAGALQVRMSELWAWPDEVPPPGEVPPAAEEAVPRRDAPASEQAAVLTVRQVADLLGIHPATLYAHMESGRFPLRPLPLPGRTRFSRAQVERFLAGESSA